ncbi:MAG: hypothetical protein AMJ58_00965 [Gammaproteobacteria bacterium SG8_30]|nr:MAG: hypothetical protein AMJ58_00965 [Gammaproteobacteria bacterium SG8_30]
MADTLPAWLPVLFGAAGRVAPEAAGRAAAALLTRPGGRNPPQPWELEPDALAPSAVVLGCGLRALAWGREGPLVLAQHGWRGRPTQFRRLAAALVPRGYRLVAIDGPGHGVSPGRSATPRRFADAMLAAADELGGAEALVGHSLGGAATAIAVQLGLPARRLVVMSGPSRASRMVSGYADQLRLPAAARAAFDRWFDQHAGRPVAELDLVSIRLSGTTEALVVHDLGDEVIPVDEARLLERAWPSARFLYTQGLGHRELLADAAVVESVVDFLAGGRVGRSAAQEPGTTRPVE